MCLTGTLSAIKLINRPDHTLTYQHLLARQKFHKLCDQQVSFLPNKQSTTFERFRRGEVSLLRSHSVYAQRPPKILAERRAGCYTNVEGRT